MEYLNNAVAFYLTIAAIVFVACLYMLHDQQKAYDNFLSCMEAKRTGQPMIFKMADELAKAKTHAMHNPGSSWAVNEASWKELQLNEYIRVNGSL